MRTNKRIAILTTARSDFGPLKRLIRLASEHFHVYLLIAGSHFLNSRGLTVTEIEKEFKSESKVTLVRLEAMVDGNSAMSQVETITATQKLASRWFEENDCDSLVFLGDRWELWGVTLPAYLHRVPLVHISGGEVTEGVIDDAVRHSHTKISSLHFAATELYATNISSMGEEDWRINLVGECGLDQIYDSEFASAEEVRERFDIDLDKETFLITFHPSTLDFDTPVKKQIGALLEALECFSDRQLVFTAPGLEIGSQSVLAAIKTFVARHPESRFVEHLGSRCYLAVMRSARAVIGNSSSGLIEASSFGVPAVNIGFRQKNRLAAESVKHVGYDPEDIRNVLKVVQQAEYQEFARACPNPYDPFRDGKNSERIVVALVNALMKLPRKHLLLKKFDTGLRKDQWNKLLIGNF